MATPKKKTDREIKMLIADYIECGNYSEVARRYGVSVNTVKNYVNDPNYKEVQEFARENAKFDTADIEAYMESKKGKVIEIVERYMDALLDEEKIKNATPNQLTTAMGTVLDKFTGIKGKDSVQLNVQLSLQDKKAELDEILRELRDDDD